MEYKKGEAYYYTNFVWGLLLQMYGWGFYMKRDVTTIFLYLMLIRQIKRFSKNTHQKFRNMIVWSINLKSYCLTLAKVRRSHTSYTGSRSSIATRHIGHFVHLFEQILQQQKEWYRNNIWWTWQLSQLWDLIISIWPHGLLVSLMQTWVSVICVKLYLQRTRCLHGSNTKLISFSKQTLHSTFSWCKDTLGTGLSQRGKKKRQGKYWRYTVEHGGRRKIYILQSFIFLLAEFCDFGLFTKSGLKSPHLEGNQMQIKLSNIATTRHKTWQPKVHIIRIELEKKKKWSYLFSKIFLRHFLDYLRRMTTEGIVTAQAYYHQSSSGSTAVLVRPYRRLY